MFCTKWLTLKLASLILLIWLYVDQFQNDSRPISNGEEDNLSSGLFRNWHPRQRHLANILDLQLKNIRLFAEDHRSNYAEFAWVVTKTAPSFPICIYNIEKDTFISAALKSDGIWEPFITKVYQRVLNKYPEAWVIDIGANIGYYTLLSARMGHNVIAVEPVQENYRRLHASIQLAHLAGQVYIVTNALSDRHVNVSLSKNADNQGGIRVIQSNGRSRNTDASTNLVPTATMDDLLQILQTSQAIIKLDIEGYECKVLKRAQKFFKNVHVPYILMEWKQMFIHQRTPQTSCSTLDMKELCDSFARQGYEPHEIQTHIKLNPARCTTIWRIGDIYWKHLSAKSIHPG